MRRFRTLSRDVLFRHRLLTLERHKLEGEGLRRDSLVVRAPDWVNVIPLLPCRDVVLVRQWRFGRRDFSLEIPGGMVDPGELPEQAAARELLEETGYTAGRWRSLGFVEPNPAILSNRCWTFLAEELCLQGEPSGDGEEELEVLTLPLDEIAGRIREGEIRHSLVIAAFHLHGIGAAVAR